MPISILTRTAPRAHPPIPVTFILSAPCKNNTRAASEPTRRYPHELSPSPPLSRCLAQASDSWRSCAGARRSFDLDAGDPDDLLPALGFVAHEFRELFGRAAARLRALTGEALR